MDKHYLELLERLDELLPQTCNPPMGVGMNPTGSVENAAEYMKQHGLNSVESEVWLVYSERESPPVDPNTHEMDGSALASAITGNGPRSKTHAYLYATLHNAAPYLRRWFRQAEDENRRLREALLAYMEPAGALPEEIRAQAEAALAPEA